MTDSVPQGHTTERRKRGYSYKSQRKYAIEIGAWLFLASIIAFGPALVAPYILPAMKWISPLSGEERSLATEQILVLAQGIGRERGGRPNKPSVPLPWRPWYGGYSWAY